MSSGLKLEVDIDDVDMYHHSVIFFANSSGFGALSRNVNEGKFLSQLMP
jgi:hypothetical protein